MEEGENMIYILLMLIGIKLNMGVIYWISWALWIVLSPFLYSVKHYLFYDHIRKDK